MSIHFSGLADKLIQGAFPLPIFECRHWLNAFVRHWRWLARWRLSRFGANKRPKTHTNRPFQLPALFCSSSLLADHSWHWSGALVIHRVVLAGVMTCVALFLALLYPARATDLLREVQQTAQSSQVTPVVPPQKPTRTATPNDSIFFFAGRLSTSNMGSTLTFNTIAVDTTLISPYYDNYIVGAAYQRRIRELGSGFVLGGEIGVADRFGHYAVCCTIQTETTSDIRHSGELWFGPTIRYESFVLFDQFRITPGLTAGFSLTTNSIGIERGRELSGNGNGRFLGYLGTELAFSSVSMPNLELVFRLHHRSGALRLIGNMMEGYNANVVGLRYWF